MEYIFFSTEKATEFPEFFRSFCRFLYLIPFISGICLPGIFLHLFDLLVAESEPFL